MSSLVKKAKAGKNKNFMNYCSELFRYLYKITFPFRGFNIIFAWIRAVH